MKVFRDPIEVHIQPDCGRVYSSWEGIRPSEHLGDDEKRSEKLIFMFQNRDLILFVSTADKREVNRVGFLILSPEYGYVLLYYHKGKRE